MHSKKANVQHGNQVLPLSTYIFKYNWPRIVAHSLSSLWREPACNMCFVPIARLCFLNPYIISHSDSNTIALLSLAGESSAYLELDLDCCLP